jgi:ABC-type dipeptide/oligopeptide/nickel transport system permease subunit
VGAPLGTDFLGRDILSRVLDGGRSVLELSTAAISGTYLLGIGIGLVAGYSRTLADPLLMRAVDVVLSFPPLLLVLVLLAGAGSGVGVLVIAVAVVLAPGVARIVRTATLETATRGYVESAVARGERTTRILVEEILPNIAGPIIADAGVRYGYSIVVIASVNYLGLGLKPPAANWALMVSENRDLIATNPYSVLVRQCFWAYSSCPST